VKIYLLKTEKIHPIPGMISSGFKQARELLKVEYFLKQETAKSRLAEIERCAKGFMGAIALTIEEIEVKE
jgi:hypothetical protein